MNFLLTTYSTSRKDKKADVIPKWKNWLFNFMVKYFNG